MNPDNAYAELGLNPGASEAEVKAAWRRLASQWHPDRNRSDAAISKMQRINQAVEQLRRNGGGQNVGASATPSPKPRHTEPPAAAPAAAESPPPKVRTISRTMKLTLEEAAAGCVKVVRGNWSEPCATCEGAGFGAIGAACGECDGAGEVRQRSWFGWSAVPMKCAGCNGEGVVKQACEDCDGTGKAPQREYRINVRIPHGVRDGDQLQVGQRVEGADHTVVQVNLRVKVSPHAFFELQADGTVHCEVPVDGFAWIANRSIDVPTLSGMQRLRLSRECLSYRLEGQGFPAERRGRRGDQLVKISPVFPERLGTDQEILLDQLIATSSGPSGASEATPLGAWRRTVQAWEEARRER